ncbi:MAG: hypothetical protein IT376_14320 [Polyangiaceae bacterium]|nr:hypothetical protein [Polyangiaceae bacterium]
MALAASTTAALCNPAALPEDPPSEVPPLGTPQPQRPEIPIEVWVGGEWMPVHASQRGMEVTAELWCWFERTLATDDRSCGFDDVTDIPALVNRPPGDVSSAAAPGGDIGSPTGEQCRLGLCLERNSLCAGYLLEEAARAVAPRTLDPLQLPGNLAARFPLLNLGVPAGEIQQFVERGGSPEGTERLRLQPLTGRGRAAALRGAANRYLFSTRWAEGLRTVPVAGGSTCLDFWAVDSEWAQVEPPAIAAHPDGAETTWLDLYFKSFVEAAVQYTTALPASVSATHAAAEAGEAGRHAPEDQIATYWNGEVDSATGAARLLAFGLDDLPAPAVQAQAASSCSGERTAAEIGPSAVPVCPPLRPGTVGARHLLTQLRIMPSPAVAGSLQLALNGMRTTLGLPEIGDRTALFAEYGTTVADVEQASTYLCQEARAFGTTLTPTGALGAEGVGRAHRLSAAVLTTHFLGAASATRASALGSNEYAAAGGIRGLDALKLTTAGLVTHPMVGNLHPTLNQATRALLSGLAAEVGHRRLEFLVRSSGATVDAVVVRVHGTPLDGSERFAAVQGLAGLECVIEGSVAGADCDAGDYLVLLSGAVTALDPRMIDLSGGTLEVSVTRGPRPGAPDAAIDPAHALYVLRGFGGTWQPFGGVVPTAGVADLQIPGYADPPVTRQVMAPAGGTYEEVLAGVLTPNSDDCSKGATSCAGLPNDFWPPLESEVNGQPSEATFERSWQHYLELAKAAAAEADRLGNELIEQGLRMDLRGEAARDVLLELCGPDGASESACPQPDDGEHWVTLGDRQFCAWSFGGEFCGCAPGDATCTTAAAGACPTLLGPGGALALGTDAATVDANRATCAGMLGFTADGYTYVPVAHALGLAGSPDPSDAGSTFRGACNAFSQLRQGTSAALKKDTPELSARSREAFIRANVMQAGWGMAKIRGVAAQMQYEEHFLDNFSLTYAGSLVFDTRRQGGQSSSSFGAPCVAPADGTSSGSAFWTTVRPVCAEPVDCQGSGPLDGCGAGPAPSQLAFDTQPDVLRSRWAWGFGHLRRSAVTLALLSGDLGGPLKLARVAVPAYLMSSVDEQPPAIRESADRGGCRPSPVDRAEPAWMWECAHAGKTENYADTRCVSASADAGAFDQERTGHGRPVNVNGFIPKWLPRWPNATVGGLHHPTPAWFDDQLTDQEFPASCTLTSGAWSCSAAPGVDPQMPYCGIPDAVAGGYPSWTGDERVRDGKSTAWVGGTRSALVDLAPVNASGDTFLEELWEQPPAGAPFCDPAYEESLPQGKKHLHGAWRALCSAFDEPVEEFGALSDDQSFVRFGLVPGAGAPFADGKVISGWLAADAKPVHSQYLFDLRAGAVGPFTQGLPPFQYPLTPRNIFDALELACHMDASYRLPPPIECDDVDPATNATSTLDQIAGAFSCLSETTERRVATFVVGPIGADVIRNFSSGGPLSTTSGIGGKYRDAMSRQYRALIDVQSGYARIADAQRQFSLSLRAISSIQERAAEERAALDSQKFAAAARGLASALWKSAQGGSDLKPWNAFAASGSVLLDLAAMELEFEGFMHQARAVDAEEKLGTTQELKTILREVEAARAAAEGIVLGLNDLADTAAELRLTSAGAARARSRIDHADLDPATGDPQYVNVANRRIYNTLLVQYEGALERAKRYGFIARRAIELRFGVDMTRMTSDLTLVQAPSKWAGSICTLTGVDYGKIRQPNVDQPVTGHDFDSGSPIPSGEEFANEFVGGYVQKLEDFVASYPVDFPLKESDDTAVISLADDLYGVSASCLADGRNLLLFSGELGMNSSAADPANGEGWYRSGCEGTVDGAPWTGCVEVAEVPREATLSGAAVPPTDAPVYRLANAGCAAVSGAGCPADVPVYHAAGALTQRLPELRAGLHVFSVYGRTSPGAAAATPALRVVREADGAVVMEEALALTAAFQRFAGTFEVGEEGAYRVEIHPTSPVASPPVLGAAVPALHVSAAQVERIYVAGAAPDVWVRTTRDRRTLVHGCGQETGTALRERFQRRCEYVCPAGIATDCHRDGSESFPTQCFYEASFAISEDDIEAGRLIPSGQIAIGNFNYRHGRVGVNLVGTGLLACDGSVASCWGNGFVEYSLQHGGATRIRNWEGGTLYARMQTAHVEHGKALATERQVTNPPSAADSTSLEPYLKGEYEGRPLQGAYTLRIWETPGLRWEQVQDVQLVWRYHYWTRFER